jgi:hypothetical protein
VSRRESAKTAGARGASGERASLIGAYCDGLGLAAVAAIIHPAGIQIVASDSANSAGSASGATLRWWCRAGDAGRVAAGATARLGRLESRDTAPNGLAALDVAARAIDAAATRLGVGLHSDAEIAQQAASVVARVDEELARSRDTGRLKAVNQSYRSYRLQASARGEKVAPYARWVNEYRHNLVRQIAAALR